MWTTILIVCALVLVKGGLAAFLMEKLKSSRLPTPHSNLILNGMAVALAAIIGVATLVVNGEWIGFEALKSLAPEAIYAYILGIAAVANLAYNGYKDQQKE